MRRLLTYREYNDALSEGRGSWVDAVIYSPINGTSTEHPGVAGVPFSLANTEESFLFPPAGGGKNVIRIT